MNNILNFPSPAKHREDIIQDDLVQLLHTSMNDRTIVTYENLSKNNFIIVIFHYNEQPNETSRNSHYTTWGYPTFGLDFEGSKEEFLEIVDMYVDDLIHENYWWELQ